MAKSTLGVIFSPNSGLTGSTSPIARDFNRGKPTNLGRASPNFDAGMLPYEIGGLTECLILGLAIDG